MITGNITAGAIFLSGLFQGAADPSGAEASRYSDAQGYIEQLCSDNEFSGIVRVMQGGRSVFDYSCTGTRLEAEITGETTFKILSTSKHFVAALAMVLVEEGALSLDDPVTDWIEEAPESWSRVTVLDLLRHTSGLPDLTTELLDRYKSGERDAARIIQDVVASSRDIVPDTEQGWRYNNFGYDLLTIILEEAGQDSFETLMQQRVFDVASMEDALIEQVMQDSDDLTAIPDPALITGYNGSADKLEQALSYSFVQRGAGAIHASADDFEDYYRSLRSGEVLSPVSQRQMVENAVLINEEVSNGTGWFIRQKGEQTALVHTGGTNGYISSFAYLPDIDAAVVVLSNYGFMQVSDVEAALIDDLIALDQ